MRRALSPTVSKGPPGLDAGNLLLSMLVASSGVLGSPAVVAAESFEFVTEHLPEVAMDNRLAVLPIRAAPAREPGWNFDLQAGGTRLKSGSLKLQGSLLSAGISHPLSGAWSLGGLVFFDAMNFSGGPERRPLALLFAQTPLALPADARFENLRGNARHLGIGVHASWRSDSGWLKQHRWIGGLLWQRMELSGYQADYRVLTGPSAGITGTVGYSATYSHTTPFAGLEIERSFGSWTLSPRITAALPLPARGIQGRITGPGFDLRGDTAKAGNGRHFGDPFVGIGLGLTYQPLGLTLDVGTTVTQALVEPHTHKGIDSNWLMSVDWRF